MDVAGGPQPPAHPDNTNNNNSSNINSNTSSNWTHGSGSPPVGVPQAAMFVWTVCPPCIMILGIFGNVATILVMRRLKDDSSSSSSSSSSSQQTFLTALAVSDLSMLCLIVLPEWLDLMFHLRLVVFHPAVCKLMNFLSYVCNSMSGWLITGVTVQRTLAVKWPHKIRVVCTSSTTWRVIAGLLLAAGLMNLHFLFKMDVSASGSQCYYVGYSDFWAFYQSVWLWVDSLTYCILPFLGIVTCDVILSLTLFQASGQVDVSAKVSSAQTDARRKTASKTTVTVIVVSLTFLMLTLPAYVFVLADQFTVYDTLFRQTVAWAVAYNMYYANSAVNFLLYCFTGTRFRGEFVSLLRCRRCPPRGKARGLSA